MCGSCRRRWFGNLGCHRNSSGTTFHRLCTPDRAYMEPRHPTFRTIRWQCRCGSRRQAHIAKCPRGTLRRDSSIRHRLAARLEHREERCRALCRPWPWASPSRRLHPSWHQLHAHLGQRLNPGLSRHVAVGWDNRCPQLRCWRQQIRVGFGPFRSSRSRTYRIASTG
jgi:hypothetical protein